MPGILWLLGIRNMVVTVFQTSLCPAPLHTHTHTQTHTHTRLWKHSRDFTWALEPNKGPAVLLTWQGSVQGEQWPARERRAHTNIFKEETQGPRSCTALGAQPLLGGGSRRSQPWTMRGSPLLGPLLPWAKMSLNQIGPFCLPPSLMPSCLRIMTSVTTTVNAGWPWSPVCQNINKGSEAQLQGGPENPHTCLKLPNPRGAMIPLSTLQPVPQPWVDSGGSVSQEVGLLLVLIVYTFLLLNGIPL